jgi:hypothetical protein
MSKVIINSFADLLLGIKTVYQNLTDKEIEMRFAAFCLKTYSNPQADHLSSVLSALVAAETLNNTLTKDQIEKRRKEHIKELRGYRKN